MQKKYSTKVQFQTTTEWLEVTTHGLLLAAWEFAEKQSVFKKWEQVHYRMKTVKYTPLDKLKTLWASVVVGCDHTVEINDRLGEHEMALAGAVGLKRFPDQSQVNRLLTATQADQVNQMRHAHLELMTQHSRARTRSRWLKLDGGHQFLVADIDQRALAVRGKQFELARPGFFGRKRGRRGYQLTVLFFGGVISEVVDEYLDPGDTPIGYRIDDLLKSLQWLCQRLGIGREQVLIRGDAQLGTPVIIAQIQEAGFHFLFKGLSPQRAKKLLKQAYGVFWRVKPGVENESHWMCDLGEIDHLDQSFKHRGRTVRARTLVLARVSPASPPKPGRHCKRVPDPKPVVKYDYYLTDLTDRHLPVADVLPTYDDRATIERYFYDEQYALGARQVRTRHFAGEALFQLVVATTNNVLRWLQHRVFRQTELEHIGLGRLIRQAMQIPAHIFRRGEKWIVEMPQQHHLVRRLQQKWEALAPTQAPVH